jgi:transcriptional regulator with XRE-family HTH domain
MVNVEEFASRLKLMLNYYEISAAQLADKIEVQRSSISHILSGRNKPSLEFVLKILKAFPEVELYWLLNGKGTFPKVEENAEITSTPSSNIKKETSVEDNKLQSKSNSNDLAIERIVVFYKNGTFKNYTP